MPQAHEAEKGKEASGHQVWGVQVQVKEGAGGQGAGDAADAHKGFRNAHGRSLVVPGLA